MHYQRTIVRVGVLTLAIVISTQIVPWLSFAAAWPAVSPLLAVCAAVASRTVGVTLLLALPLLVLALARGRWFCRNLCPTGFLLFLVGRIAGFRRRRILLNSAGSSPGRLKSGKLSIRDFPALGLWLCFLMLGSALAGFPLLLNLDPLVQFTAFFSVWRHADWTWLAGLPALSLVVLVLISALWPHLWCERLCPLGALQGMLGSSGKKILSSNREPPTECAVESDQARAENKAAPGAHAARAQSLPGAPEIDTARRAFLVLAGGAVLGLLWKCLGAKRATAPIRPPGAVESALFSGLCARCGNCMRVCPEGIIMPDLGSGGPGSLLTPRLDFSRRYCNEWCRACTNVCPTGAIRPLTLETKRSLSIGVARVDRSICLAWRDREYCMVCHEFCSYQAIQIVKHRGVNCPVVNEALCRGCGSCQSNCPAEPARAIVVYAHEQKIIASGSQNLGEGESGLI